MRRVFSLAVLMISGVTARGAETTLIRDATVLTVTKGTVANGNVLIEDGKISAVGTDVSAPAGATVVEAVFSGTVEVPAVVPG